MSGPGSGSGPALYGLHEPIGRALLRLALPILASHAVRIAYQWVDALWVRGLGVDATAAVTTSIFVIWSMISLNDVFAIGGVAYVSQLLGAGDRPRAGAAAYLAVRGSLVLGLLGSLTGLFFGRHIYGLMSSDPGALAQGGTYLSIVLLASPFFLIGFTSESVMRAAGDSRTPFLIEMLAVGLNIVLDPILIYGWGPVPALGVAGAAWATVTAYVVMAGAYGVLALRGHPAFPITRRWAGAPVRLAGMIRVGLPAATIGVLFSVVYVAFGAVAGDYGPAALAVVGIVNRLESIEYLAAVAVGMAGAALVGQNLGAGHPDRAAAVMKLGTRWIALFSAVLAGVMFVFPEPLLRLFTEDAEALRLGVPYLRIMVACFVFNGVEIVIAESVMGSGHTVAISTIFGAFSLLRIPLAFIVPQMTGLDVHGIAWVITVTCVLRSCVIVAWALRGTWKRGLHGELGVGAAGELAPVGETPGPR